MAGTFGFARAGSQSPIELPRSVDIYVIYAGENTTLPAFQLAERVRTALPHLRTMVHYGIKQFKRAGR